MPTEESAINANSSGTTTTVTSAEKLSPPFSSTSGSSSVDHTHDHINNPAKIEPNTIAASATGIASSHLDKPSQSSHQSQVHPDSDSHPVDPPTEPNSAQNHAPITKDSPLTDIATSPPVFDLTLGNRDSISSEDHFHNHHHHSENDNHDSTLDIDQLQYHHQNHHPSHNLLSFLSNNNSIKEESVPHHTDNNTKHTTDNNLDNNRTTTSRPKQHRTGSSSHKRHNPSYKDNYESSELSDLGDDSEAETDKMDFLDDDHTPHGEKVSDLRALSELTEMAHLKEVDSDDDDDDENDNTANNNSNNTEPHKNIKSASPEENKAKLPNGDAKQETPDQQSISNSKQSRSTSTDHATQDDNDDQNSTSNSDTDASLKLSPHSPNGDSDHVSLNPKENKEAEEEIAKHIDQIKNEVAGSTSINSASVKRSLSTTNDEHDEHDEHDSVSTSKRQKLEGKEASASNGELNSEVSGDLLAEPNTDNGRIPKGDDHENEKSEMDDVEDDFIEKEEKQDEDSSSYDKNGEDMMDTNEQEPKKAGNDETADNIAAEAEVDAKDDSSADTSATKKPKADGSDSEEEHDSEDHEPEASAEVEVEAEADDDEADDDDGSVVKSNNDNGSTSATQEEVDMDEQRKLAIQELMSIETSFAELRDKLYQDKLSLLEHELQLCLEGSHPELSKIYFKINDFYQENVKLANANLSYNLKCINTETIATRTSIHQDYLKKLMDTKNDMIADTTSLWYKINKERNQMDQLVPDFNYSAIPSIPNVTVPAAQPEDLAALPAQLANGSSANHYSNGVTKPQIEQQQPQHTTLTKKAIKQNTLVELVQQRNNINHQLGILNGLLQFHGFPSALSSTLSEDKPVPSHELLLRKASEDEIMDDLQAMGIPI